MSGETEGDVSGWTTDTLHSLMIREFEAIRKAMTDLASMLQERYETQTKAVDAAFLAQQTAMQTALTAAERAVQTALLAAEKAVNKAEVSADKRFECVSIDTPVLCADLVWRPAGDLLPGDELIACDEEPLTRRGRRFRRAVVTHNAIGREPLLVVVTPRGQVRCTYNHPWLVRRGAPAQRPLWRWMPAEELRPGDSVMHALDVWQTDRSWESGWLAGMYDGEGCLTLDRNHRSQLTVTQRESATSDLLESSLKARVEFVGSYRNEPGQYKHTQPFYHFIVTRLPDILTILGSVRPPRLLAKANIAWESKPLGSWGRATEVTAIEPGGTGNIARLSTSSHTYIAGGFAMHNSVNEFRAQLADQAATFLPRTEADVRIGAIAERQQLDAHHNAERITLLEQKMSNMEGAKSGTAALYGWAVAGIGAVVSVVLLISVFTGK